MRTDGSEFDGFDPDGPALHDGIYGLPHPPERSDVVLIPVPWEATASYGTGTAGGPAAVLAASRQVDLHDTETGRPWKGGIALLPIPEEIVAWNLEARSLALRVRQGAGGFAAAVDRLSERMNTWVYDTAQTWLEQGRLVGLVGGDHSSPFGLMRALAERHPGLGILHLDAHADLRRAYEGFRYSHASIFWNVLLEIPGAGRLVQVGLRDLGESEAALIRESGKRISAFFECGLRRRLQEGDPWSVLAREVVDRLPGEVYLSFDIDGLDPALCPHTGTPVPGGLSFAEAVSLLRLTAESGRKIVGFDLCEVAPDPTGASEWDANVASRLLYKMIGYARLSGRGGN